MEAPGKREGIVQKVLRLGAAGHPPRADSADLVTVPLTPGSRAPADACSVFTKEDAAAALGEAAKGPKALSSCEYTGSGYHRVQLNLTRLPDSSVPIYKGICGEKKNLVVSGLGEAQKSK